MIVRLRLEVSDNLRRALRRRYGGRGLATREEIRLEVESLVDAHWEDVESDDLDTDGGENDG